MNPLTLALRRPVTLVVGLLALLLAGGLAISRMKVDIFPSLNLPVVYVCQPYGGMDPAQMEGLIANYYEYHFLYIGGIHHVESKNVQGVSLMKLVFHPNTDMAQVLAETVGYVNRSRAFMPPGTVPPFIMRFDTGSVPVGYLVLSSQTKTITQIQDQGLFKVRPMFASIDGVSAPPPFGGNARTVVVRVDPDRLRAYHLSAQDVVLALAQGNTISPSGAIRTTDAMPLVPVNALVTQPSELGGIPVRPGVFLRDVAPVIEDASDIPTGYALVNGQRAVYFTITKRANASTTAVVNSLRANLPKMQAALPSDIRVAFEFDQSPYVTNALKSVLVEAGVGAVLTGLMVLLFLRDWRSVIVVIVNIPVALIAAVVGLAMCGQTINLMTLSGLALAVGILVDESTVEVENIHTQLPLQPTVAHAVRAGNAATAGPRLLALLCMLAVFLPSFLMQGTAQALFLPLALAVMLAMIASYVLSSTLVPVLCVWLLSSADWRAKIAPAQSAHGSSDWTRWFFFAPKSTFFNLQAAILYLVACPLLLLALTPLVGADLFPAVDAGQIQFRLRAPVGTRIEQTEALTQEALAEIGRQVGPENVGLSLGYVGVVAPSYPILCVYLWSSGPEEAIVRVAIKGQRMADVQQKLRAQLVPHLQTWLQSKWLAEGVEPGHVAQRVRELRLSFEPADIINEVMSFGAPTPIEVQISGSKLADNRAYAEKVLAELQQQPALRDVQISQALEYPTVAVTIDREKAALTGVTAADVAQSLVAATSSSRFTVPNYWREPASGIGYQVQVEVPQALLKSPRELEQIPVRGGEPVRLLRDVASVQPGTMAGTVDRYNMRRVVSVTANVAGTDLGRARQQLQQALRTVGKPPEGVNVDIRGQVTPFEELFRNLSYGLVGAVVVVLLLLTGYFQSLRLALNAVAAVPAVLLGVVLALLATGSTINLQSFVGAIMAVGVAVANAILFVAFAARLQADGASAGEAARQAIAGRVRPILMTASAMVAGMVPLALGLGADGDQTAPLARAVIGGLLAGTATTLGVLPSVYTLLGGRTRPVSLDPTDATSAYYRAE
jgi:multidrug efflux pump subunit AcrB